MEIKHVAIFNIGCLGEQIVEDRHFPKTETVRIILSANKVATLTFNLAMIADTELIKAEKRRVEGHYYLSDIDVVIKERDNA